jgi:hypothetical protein
MAADDFILGRTSLDFLLSLKVRPYRRWAAAAP